MKNQERAKRQTEDDMAEILGPRSIPVAPDEAKVTPQEDKISPSSACLTVTTSPLASYSYRTEEFNGPCLAFN